MIPSARRVDRCTIARLAGQKKSQYPNRGTGTESANEKGIISAHARRARQIPGMVAVPNHPGAHTKDHDHRQVFWLTGSGSTSSGLVHPTVRLRLLGLPRIATGRHAFNANGLCAAGRSRSQRRVHGGFAPPSLLPRRNEAPAIVQSSVVRLACGASSRDIDCATQC